MEKPQSFAFSPSDEAGAGRPGVPGQQRGAPVGSAVGKIQTTLLASYQRLSVLGFQMRIPPPRQGAAKSGQVSRNPQRSDVSTSTHRPYCSVYSDPPQTPLLEGRVSAVHLLGQWLFDELILIFFSVNF